MSDELLNEFIFDSRDHLSTAGTQLLELEKDPASLAALNALMGTMHTIKGNSGFLDLQNLYKLMHHAESLLQTVREKQIACPSKMIDLLLQVLDTVEAVMDRLENGDNDKVDWLDTLNQALSESESKLEQMSEPSDQEPVAVLGNNEDSGQVNAEDNVRLKSPPQLVINEDLSGKVNLVTLQDGQLAKEDEVFLPRVEAMFNAGLKGLVIDLRQISSVSSSELKTLLVIGRKNPANTAYLVNTNEQSALFRIFQILHLDTYLNFFEDKDQALAYIKKC